MLDFFLIPDNQIDVKTKDLIFVGNLELDLYYRLQKKGIIEEKYSFFSDFRWNNKTIQQMLEQIEIRAIKTDTDVKKLLSILNQIPDTNLGLIAYCD